MKTLFVAREFSPRDIGLYFTLCLLCVLMMAHSVYWVAALVASVAYLSVSAPPTPLFLVVVVFAPYFLAYKATRMILSALRFKINHARRSSSGVFMLFVGEKMLLISYLSAPASQWAGGSVLMLAGFLLFFRWFTEGPSETKERLLHR